MYVKAESIALGDIVFVRFPLVPGKVVSCKYSSGIYTFRVWLCLEYSVYVRLGHLDKIIVLESKNLEFHRQLSALSSWVKGKS